MTLPDRMRAAIAAAHTAIEQTPAARAMIGGTIQRDEYVRLLGQLGRLHESLETALAGKFPGLYDAETMTRADVIRHDLVALDEYGEAEPFGVTQAMQDDVATWAVLAPWKLVGVLYVFEGSRMGSMALVRPVARALGVDVKAGTGVDYHLDGMATRPMVWQRFRATLAGYGFSDVQQAEIVHTAEATMDALHALYAAAVPADVTAQ